MFTGLIEEVGTIKRFERRGERYDLEIGATSITDDLTVDDSVAVNGVCLTVIDCNSASFLTQVVPQTVQMSALEYFHPGDRVNLERALAAGDRFGGHFVQGHVDGTAKILGRTNQDDHAVLVVHLPKPLARYCVPQGSIAIDGVSLTIAHLEGQQMDIALIPHTLSRTTLGGLVSGRWVNIEVDMLSKYVEHHLQHKSRGSLSEDWLKKQGF